MKWRIQNIKLRVKENTFCEEKIFSPSKTFANVMRNCDVHFYTGFINTDIFNHYLNI